MDEITLIEVLPQKVIGIRKTGTYARIPELLMKIYGFVTEKHIPLTGMPTFLCHETSPEAVKDANEKGTAVIEVAWPVSGTVSGSGDLQVYELPGGKMVRTVHHGPYESCEPTYLRIFAWIEEHHLRIVGPIREIYHNDPRVVRPEEIITEIQIPVR